MSTCSAAAPAAPAETTAATDAADRTAGAKVSRPGALGWGVQLEGPTLGVLAATGETTAWGYSLGGALSWEILAGWQVRAFAWGGRAPGSRAQIRFLAEGEPQTAKVGADWSGLHTGVGLTHVFRGTHRDYAPFVGLDGGLAYDGFRYGYAETLERLRGEAANGGSCPATRCPAPQSHSLSLGWSLGLRGGMQLRMLRWLATRAELSVTYAPVESVPVTNTLTSLRVASARQDTWLVRASFSVQLGI